MQWLLEDPLPIALGGIVAAVLAAAIVAQHGRTATFVAVSVVSLVTVGLLLLESFVVTTVEEVENTLAAIAADLTSNDVDAVTAHISPSHEGLRRLAQSRLGEFEIMTAKIGSDLNVTINQLTSPPSAIAEFTGRIELNKRRGQLVHNNVVRRFTVNFAREGEKWLVSGYNERN